LLERLRYLCRIAHARRVLSSTQFEAAVRKLDTAGRMLFGWRRSLGMVRNKTATPAPEGAAP
jgi:hypothetical protein